MRLVAALTFLTALSSQAAASSLLRTRNGAAVHWDNREIRIAVDETTNSRHLSRGDVLAAVDGAGRAWNALAEMQIRFVTTSSSPDVVVHFCQDSWKAGAGLLAHTEFDADINSGVVTAAT